MTILLLVRHGECDFTRKGLAGRLPEIHLNEQGRLQAELLAEKLSRIPIKTIFSSPLERAIETAQPLADRLGLVIQLRPALLEVDYGKWQGRTYRQIRRTKLWEAIKNDPTDIKFPDGESLVDVQKRVYAEINTLASVFLPNDIIACFTHGDVIRLSAAGFLNMNLDDFHRISIGLGSVTVIQAVDRRVNILHLNQVFNFDLSSLIGKE